MAILLHHINYRKIQLTADIKNETVPVRHMSGEYRYLPYLGFIEREEAQKGVGTPVAIKIDGYAVEDFNPRWIMLEGKHIQGCLFAKGVCAVIDNGVPRILPK